jgi:hypothetical protein
MTADGLFQRLAFVRTLARDYKQAWNQLMWGYHHPIPDDLKAQPVHRAQRQADRQRAPDISRLPEIWHGVLTPR